jgi:hypothetical protein
MDDAQRTPTTDLLTGLEEIAAYLGWTVRQTKHRDAAGELPTFRLGKGRTVYARRSTLARHFAAQEAAAKADR